jgi:predicted nucleic acid-binding protein
MKYLLDTNIVSELRKTKANQQVVDWVKSIDQERLYLSCITIGEIKMGALKKQLQDKVAGDSLLKWLDQLVENYADRILAIDRVTCEQWGELLVRDSTNSIDALLAAQAIEENMILATRNTKHFINFKVKLWNPFE